MRRAPVRCSGQREPLPELGSRARVPEPTPAHPQQALRMGHSLAPKRSSDKAAIGRKSPAPWHCWKWRDADRPPTGRTNFEVPTRPLVHWPRLSAASWPPYKPPDGRMGLFPLHGPPGARRLADDPTNAPGGTVAARARRHRPGNCLSSHLTVGRGQRSC